MTYELLVQYLECVRTLPKGEAYAICGPVDDDRKCSVARSDDSSGYAAVIARLAAEVSQRHA
jgi:hypothetical protein